MDNSAARACTTLFRWYRALSSTTVTGPTEPTAATFCSNAHMVSTVSVFTTVVFVTDTNARVTASHAPSTLNRCRPLAARTNTRTIDHRQHKYVPYTQWAASTNHTWPRPATAASRRGF